MLTNRLDISGVLSQIDKLSGELQGLATLSGNSTIPFTIEKNFIHYDSTEAWNSRNDLVAQRGHIYIYSDYEKETLPDGSEVYYPAAKIGDGTSYLIDMPFSMVGDDVNKIKEFEDHIKNTVVHVSTDDRTSWDNRVTASVPDGTEELIFSIRSSD